MKWISPSLILILVSFTLSAQPTPRAVSAVTFRELPSPAGAGSGQPFLHPTPAGDVLMSWVESGGKAKHSLRFALYKNRSWTSPSTVAEGNDFFVNWADVPSVASFPNGRMVAHWLNKSGPTTYAYDVLLKTSTDGGKTWSPAIKAHRDATQTEHGFVSLFEMPDKRIGGVWLDGRDMQETSESSHDNHDMKGSMQLRFTTLGPRGHVQEETILDPRVCECCPTAVAVTTNSVVVAYRDRSDKEVRDISIVRFRNESWSDPRKVHSDDWKIPGCPVNGPALSAKGDNVVIAWFTGANSDARVNAAFSTDEGANFGPPIRLDGGKPLGRVDAELLPDGSALVSWIEWKEEGAEFKVRRVQPNGALGDAVTVSSLSAERASGYPRIVADDTSLYAAWTDVQGSKRIRFASVRLSDIP